MQPLHNVLRKVMIYKYESNNHPTIDPDCPVIPASVQVPVFPQAMEVIRTSDGKLLQVSSVYTENKTIPGLLLRQVRGRNPRSVQRSQHTVPFVNIVQIVPYVLHAGGIRLMPSFLTLVHSLYFDDFCAISLFIENQN